MDRSNHLQGRPPLAEGKRTRKIDVRFSEEEYRKIEALEKELGMKKADLVRMRLLDNAAAVVVNAGALMAGIDNIGAELGRAGNNINQLAHHANILRLQDRLDPLLIDRFNGLMEDYLSLQQKLEVSLRKVLKEMSRGRNK